MPKRWRFRPAFCLVVDSVTLFRSSAKGVRGAQWFRYRSTVHSWGRYSSSSVFVFLSRSVFLFFLVFAAISSAQTSSKTAAPLTHANQIRRLSAERATQAYPVKIRGVITEDAPALDFFVLDLTAGIYVEGSHSPVFEHNLGDLVEIEGVTAPGKFAPVIRRQNISSAGQRYSPQGQTVFHEARSIVADLTKPRTCSPLAVHLPHQRGR